MTLPVEDDAIGAVTQSIDGGRTFNHIGLSTLVVGSMTTNRSGTRLYAAVYGAGIFVTSVGLSPNDVAIDFGPTRGLWLQQGAGWSPLHQLSPEAMVTGDLDGNGLDDLVVDFGPGFGVWAWMNHTTWLQLHASSPSLFPDLVIAPLLGFDARGWRLGYGGGFYDRTLRLLRRDRPTAAIGFAFELQRLDEVPIGPFDERLDRVATEAALHDCRGDH